MQCAYSDGEITVSNWGERSVFVHISHSSWERVEPCANGSSLVQGPVVAAATLPHPCPAKVPKVDSGTTPKPCLREAGAATARRGETLAPQQAFSAHQRPPTRAGSSFA